MDFISSIRRSMNLFVVLIVLCDSVNGLRLQTEHSSISGLVTEATIGLDGSKIKVALDFNRPETRIFDPAICPAFVECSQVNIINDRRMQTQLFVSESELGLLGGYWTFQSLVFGGEVLDRFAFQLVRNWVPQLATFRDVAGVIGAAKGSQAFWNRCIEMGIDGEKIILEDCSGPPRFSVETFGHQEWRFRSDWSLNGRPVIDAIKTEFDPTFTDIVFPITFMKALAVGMRAQIDSEYRLRLLCRDAERLELTLRVDSVFPVTIAGDSLNMGEVNSLYPGICSLRIRFTESRVVTIGHHLINSVGRIQMDFASKYFFLGFVSGPPPSVTPLPSVRLVPIYGLPRLHVTTGGPSVVFPSTEADEGVVLVNPDARSTRDRSGRWRVWTLIRTRPLLEEPTEREMVISPSFEGFSFTVNQAAIEFRGTGYGNQQVYLEFSRSIIQIRVKERSVGSVPPQPVRITDLEMPKPEPYKKITAQDDVSCSICMGSYEPNDLVQEMDGCKHSFHRACIKQWLETRSATCPICRGQVYRRQQMNAADNQCCIIS